MRDAARLACVTSCDVVLARRAHAMCHARIAGPGHLRAAATSPVATSDRGGAAETISLDAERVDGRGERRHERGVADVREQRQPEQAA